jgi:aminoglycoside phosphotransferase (APT) family kinase protein
VLPGARIVRVEPLSGGFGNENLLLVTAGGERYVLRRYRRQAGGHTCAVEAALARRVAGTVPVPAVVAARTSGEPLLLSEFVPGVLASTVLDDDPGELGAAIGGALAAIGTIRFATQGFFEHPDLVPTPVDVTSGLADFVARHTDWPELLALAERSQPLLDALPGQARLVHSDFNPKNVIMRRLGGAWTVSAVLDWEFAFSGPPLVDVGNMLRFGDDYPPAFTDGFVRGFRDGGGELPPGWRAAAEAVDLFALADLLSRGPGSPLYDRVVAVLERRVR